MEQVLGHPAAPAHHLLQGKGPAGRRHHRIRTRRFFCVFLCRIGRAHGDDPDADTPFQPKPHHYFRITDSSFVDHANDYHKRDHVFRFIPTPGTEIFLAGGTGDETMSWIQGINMSIKKERSSSINLMEP